MKNYVVVMVAILLIATAAYADWVIEEGFEEGDIPADWTIIDANNDGDQWFALEFADYAHTGSWMAAVASYGSTGDDWLITPQVSVTSGDVFEFYARAWINTEDFEVRLSTTGTSTGDFDVLLDSVTGIGESYVNFVYDLSPYAGQDCYLAVRWLLDYYGFVVDDVRVGQETTPAGVTSLGAVKALY